MNITLFRSLIVLVFLTHVIFVIIESPSAYYADDAIYLLPLNIWLIIYLILAASLVGLFLLYKSFRFVFLMSVIVCIGIVSTQGSILFSALQNVLMQVGCGLYGGIITMSYFSDIKWRESPNN